MVNNDYYSRNYQDICTVADLLSDERSFEIYLKFISAYLSMDSFKFSSEEEHCQYFPNDILLKSGYSRFIDCGAYNGDTFLELIRQQKQVEYYIAYEPDLNSFEKLKNTIIKSGFHNPCILFPCGVSSKNCIQNLCLNGSSSNLSISGDTITQSLTIDDTILNVFPTFIKMDVEGAEYDAILGAKKIIHNFKPVLAICVYHRADDIWRIPLLLKKIVPEYRFYLRTYTSYGLETVLYAVS